MNLKKIIIFWTFIHWNVFATTNVLFSNDSAHSYSVSSKLLDSSSNLERGRDYQTTDNLSIEQYLPNMTTLKFNSNVNIKNGKEYHFNVTIQNNTYPNRLLNFYITTKGLFTGSKIIETKVVLPSGEIVELNPQQNSSFAVPDWNFMMFHFVTFQQSESGVYWPSYVLAADQNNEPFFDFSSAHTFKAMNYNTQLFPFYADVAVPPNNKKERAQSIPKLIANQYDYVSLNEVLDRDLRGKIIADMKAYYPYYIDAPGMEGSNILSGGVVTFSKWPILQVKQMVYQNCGGYECLSNKGATYIKIQKSVNDVQQNYHIFSTHLQAGDDSQEQRPYYQARAKQIRELNAFILAQNISPAEAVLISGDLNVNKYSEQYGDYQDEYLQTEHQYLLKTLNATAPVQTGLKYSFDGILNSMLGLSSNEQSSIDYVLYLNDHKVPTNAVNHTKTMRDPFNYALYPAYDTSDHFPVIGAFIFSE